MSDIFSADELQADQQGPNDAPEVVETQEQQRARDEQGRFAAKPVEEAAPEGEQQEGKPPAGTVPQGALHAEREKRKGIENELKSAREQLAQIQQLREQVAARKPEPLPAEDDPAQIQHLRQRLQQIEQAQTQTNRHLDEQALNQQESQQIGALIQASENEYRQQQPDYDPAIQHLVNARANELRLYGLSPLEVDQTIRSEVMDIARSAIQQGRNPAELGYQIALSRGYVAQQPQAQPQGAAAQLAAISQAKGQSRSLGQAAGSTPQNINAETIANMGPEEFDALYSTPQGRAMIDAL